MAFDITVTLENQPGRLADLGEALGEAGINAEGACGVVFEGKGYIHLLVDDPDEARSALNAAGFLASVPEEVLVAPVENHPGGMGAVARKLAEAGVNIHLTYLTVDGQLAMGVDDLETARKAL
jgi:hypothetical protein